MRKKLVGRDWQKQRVVQSILKDVRDDLHDDALVHRILHEKVSQDPAMQHETLGQRAADKLAAFAGSWLFLLTFVVLLLGWMIFNAVMAARAFESGAVLFVRHTGAHFDDEPKSAGRKGPATGGK